MKKASRFALGGLVAGLCAAAAFVLVPIAKATETTGEKIQSGLEEAGTSVKKSARKARRTVRDKTGNGSVKEDIKDGVNNASDDAKDAGRKLKRKAD